MTPYEVMLCESQERMLVVVAAGARGGRPGHFRRWELHSDVIGHVTDDGIVRIRDGGEKSCGCRRASSPSRPSTAARASKPSRPRRRCATYDLAFLPDIVASELGSRRLLALLRPRRRSPASAPVYRQYDHPVLTNTVIGPGADAAVLRIKGHRRGPSPWRPTATGSMLPRPVCGRRDRRRRGRPQRRLQRREAAGGHGLPQLRQPGAPDVYFQLEEASGAWRRPAERSACR